MESVIFDGKEFIKASVLAKRFKYTPDYLGQLCRAKKVDARLVGRSWYINLDSLHEHKGSRYKNEVKKPDKPQSVSTSISIHEPHYLTCIDVEPILKGKTVRLLKETKTGLRDVPVRYEHDDNALIPKVAHGSVKKTLLIDIAESERVKVDKTGVRPAFFKPEPIPEVYLKGKLSVEGLPESIEITEPAAKESIENTSDIGNLPAVKSDIFSKESRVSTSVPKLMVRRTLRTGVVNNKTITDEKKPVFKEEISGNHTPVIKSVGTVVKKDVGKEFTPNSVKNHSKIKAVQKAPSTSFFQRFLPLIFFGLAVVICSTTLFLKNDISVKNNSTYLSYEFDFDENLFQKIRAFYTQFFK